MRKKVIQQLSLAPDIREELRKQASEAGFTVSGYIERIVLERKVRKETLEQLDGRGKKNLR